MGLFSSKNDGGVMDVIRCDEQEYLIWKWHPQGTTSQTSQRANAIRWGSSLRVRDGSVAVFVYSDESGGSQDFIEGPYDQIIDTKNFPVLATLVGKLYQGGSPFQAEIYFINTANLIQIPFGVQYFDVFDPRFTDYGVPVAVRGSLNFRIADYREFVKLHSLAEFNIDSFKHQVKDCISNNVKGVVSNIPQKHGIPVVQLGRQITEIGAIIEADLSEKLRSEYGVSVSSVNVSDIEIDKDSEGYKKLEKLTQNKANSFVQGAANILDTMSTHRAGAKGIINSAKNEEGAQTPGLGEKVSNAFGGLFKGKDKSTPPPIPTAGYYVAIDGKKKGPYDISKLNKMKSEGAIDEDTLVWKEGMENWQSAVEVDALSSLFEVTD